MKNNEYFKFHEGCFIHKGAKNGAIYDVVGNEVYSVDGRLVETLQKVSKIGDIVREVKRFNIKDKEIKSYLRSLVDLGIAFIKENDIYVHPIKSKFNSESHVGDEKIKLSTLTCELLSDCNLNCVHCNNRFSCYCGRNYNDGESLSQQEWKNIIKDASNMACENIRLMGGEPFLYNEIIQIIELCSELKFKKVSIFTNGTLINEEIINTLKNKKNVSLIIPIYSLDSDIHDVITRNKGSYSKTLQNILKLKRNDIDIAISIFVQAMNISTVADTINFCCSYLDSDIIFDILVPPNDMIFRDLPDECFNFKLKTKAYFDQIDLNSFTKRQIGNSCWLYSAAIKSNGDIVPCIKARNLIIGSLRNKSLHDFVSLDCFDKFWYLTKQKIDGCKDCEYIYACDDCRLIALQHKGTLYSKYPFCKYNPHTSSWD